MNSDWEKKRYRFAVLERIAQMTGPYTSIVAWLKDLYIIPREVESMRVAQVKLDLDPLNIEAGYLAAVAFEWDSWGASHPEDFIDALRCELRGSGERDTVSAILLALGRVSTEGTNAA